MTRYRAAFGGLSILAVAVSAAFDVYGQAKSTGSMTMRDASGGLIQTCTNYQFTLDTAGTLDVMCTGVTPTPSPTPPPTPTPTPSPTPGTETGKVQFHANSMTVTRPVSSAVNVPITIDRVPLTPGGVPTVGSVSSTIKVQGGDCAPAGTSIPFTIPAGQLSLTLPANTVMATGSTTCGIAMLGGDVVTTSQKFTSTFVAINVVADPTPTPSPTPSPTPTPTGGSCMNPAGQLITAPGTIKMQTMYMGGTNNYAVDDLNFVNPPPGTDANTILGRVTASAPAGSIQVFTVPKTWSDGITPAPSVHVGFVDWLLNGIGVQYEIALSTCPGDFSYYKTATAIDNSLIPGAQPCGVVSGPTVSLNWSPGGSFIACKTNVAPNATWYMNWRIVPGTASGCAVIGPGSAYHTCGTAFGTNAF